MRAGSTKEMGKAVISGHILIVADLPDLFGGGKGYITEERGSRFLDHVNRLRNIFHVFFRKSSVRFFSALFFTEKFSRYIGIK